MATPTEQLRPFQARYVEVQSELAALRAEMQTLERILVCFGLLEHAETGNTTTPRRNNIKAIVIDLLEEVGCEGLNAAIAVKLGTSKGIDLDRGSVSSLLSRLKRDNAVIYDGRRYTLRQFAKPNSKRESEDSDSIGAEHAMA